MFPGFFLVLFILNVSTGRHKEITWGFATKTSVRLVLPSESNPSFINVSNPRIHSFVNMKNIQINGFYESECLISNLLEEDSMKIIKFEMNDVEYEVPIRIFEYENSDIISLKGSSKYDRFFYESLLEQLRSSLRYLVESILYHPKKYKKILKNFKKCGNSQVEKSFKDDILPKLNLLLTDIKKKCKHKSTNFDINNITECTKEFMNKNFTEKDVKGLIEKYINFGDFVMKSSDDEIYETLVARCNDLLLFIAELMGNKLKINSYLRANFYITIKVIKGLRVKATDANNVPLFDASGSRIYLNLEEDIIKDEESPTEYFIIPNEIIENKKISYVMSSQIYDINED
jgi:hypothetical protein